LTFAGWSAAKEQAVFATSTALGPFQAWTGGHRLYRQKYHSVSQTQDACRNAVSGNRTGSNAAQTWNDAEWRIGGFNLPPSIQPDGNEAVGGAKISRLYGG
jgi:hypothetical protein